MESIKINLIKTCSTPLSETNIIFTLNVQYKYTFTNMNLRLVVNREFIKSLGKTSEKIVQSESWNIPVSYE